MRDRRSVVFLLRQASGQAFNTAVPLAFLDLGANIVAPYTFDNARTNKQLELKHGSLQKCWNMDRVSNAEFPAVSIVSLKRIKHPQRLCSLCFPQL